MNDFTKEELEFFVQSMGYHEWIHNGPLITKVQSMIDNYCKHEFYVNGCGENAFGQCHKCGEVRRLTKKV